MLNVYHILDIFFLTIHSLLIVFNLFGWIWKPLRIANLISLLLTLSSWVILGFFYGFGYCPLTDWHWKVLRHLGESDIPASYIKYLADRIFGYNFNPVFVDYCTGSFFTVAFVASIAVNIYSFNNKNRK